MVSNVDNNQYLWYNIRKHYGGGSVNILLKRCSNYICQYKKEATNDCSIIGTICNNCRSLYGMCEYCAREDCRDRGAANIKLIKEKEARTDSFKKDDEKIYEPTAYVDGSFKNGIYGYGCVITNPDGKRHGLRGSDNKPELAEMRNVAGEILGAMAAVKYALEHRFPSLTIYYDYIGIEKWAKDEWKANKPATQAYKEYMNNCSIPLTFIKVKGHSGNKGNELADQLAKKAVGIV